MTKNKKAIRVGIVGLGNMGVSHAKLFQGVDPKITGAVLTAVCDTNPESLQPYKEIDCFQTVEELIQSGKVDAVIIATPHYAHTTVGIQALEAGLHVLVEKPISVHKADCERLIAAHQDPKIVFSAMFNQRTDPFHLKIRSLIQSGELGKLRRVNWIITNWFRTESYYRSGGWRATWKGEGGGVLLNQCPHNLDLWQWMFGMPDEVWADCRIGRYHDIEVEDEVTAYLKYDTGLSGIFITSTGEGPGTNRLEVTGERGKLIYEEGTLRFFRNEVDMSEFSRSSENHFMAPPIWEIKIPLNESDHGTQHAGILQNFIQAIQEDAELIAPAAEGIHSIELANAMLYSSEINQPIQLPLDAAIYETFLKKKIAESTFEKAAPPERKTVTDLSTSFNTSP